MTDQAEKLRMKIDMLRGYKQAKTIAIVSGKGGVGKSNFALNFALGLTNRHRKVLVFDLDIGMGNIDILLGVTPKKTIVNMFDDHLSIHDVIEKGPGSLSYIAAGSGLTDIFSFDESKFNYFLDQLKELVKTYDYIIFDMGAGITEATIYYMLAADECFVVTTPEPTALTDAYGMIKHVSYKNMELPIYLLVNRAMNPKSGEQTMDRMKKVVEKFLEKDLKPLGILPEDKVVLQAVSNQTPFFLYEPNALASLAIKQIVDQYMTNTIDIKMKIPYSFINKLKRLIKER